MQKINIILVALALTTSIIARTTQSVSSVVQNELLLSEIVARALDNNGEIKIARLEVEKARARLSQARLRPNPSLEVEHGSGSLVGSPGDRELSLGVSLPLELSGQRASRIDLARAEIVLKEAEVVSREREIAVRIFADYADAVTSMRELQILDEVLSLDNETVKFVQIRVNEGETAPLELSLVQTEVARLRVQRELAAGKLNASLTKLKYYAGIPDEEPLALREELSAATFTALPVTLEASLDAALQNRPEIRLARLEEELAMAGLRLIRSQSKPEISATAKFSRERAVFDDPLGPYSQSNKSLTLGVSIGLPVFNRNQGTKAEAQIAIRQAQERRIFAERIVRNEVAVAFRRIEATRRAVSALETAVLPRSRENIEVTRRMYELGEIKITDLIVEQRRLLDANRDLTEALSERYRSQADLFIALGLTF